jgi:hypothetical protein|tara:strand:- start:57 stop:440 length:384 start_codon:yes stop_codon:yes gene_type:complete
MKCIDKVGNKLWVDSGKVFLKLVNKKTRNIGQAFEEGGYVFFNKVSKDIYRNLQAFGFCEIAIREIQPDYITVKWIGDKRELKRGLYKIDKKKFEEVKIYQYFKKEGFELQCFVRIKDFEYIKEVIK